MRHDLNRAVTVYPHRWPEPVVLAFAQMLPGHRRRHQKVASAKPQPRFNLGRLTSPPDSVVLLIDVDPQANLTSGVASRGKRKRRHRLPGADRRLCRRGSLRVAHPGRGLSLVPPTATSPARSSSSSPCRTASAGCVRWSNPCAIDSTTSSSIRRRRWGCSRSTRWSLPMPCSSRSLVNTSRSKASPIDCDLARIAAAQSRSDIAAC